MSTLYVVGMGPGDGLYRTAQADQALRAADLICGYEVYVDLVRPDYPDTPVFTTPMMRERERCERALLETASGKTVAMVCSGDSGVYGMAGLLYELLDAYPGVSLEIVPGITAALSGAALLGSPLTNDFAVVSLSDLLTPWEVIEKRLRAAAEGDFVICLYNPSSKRRADHLRRACDIVLTGRSPGTACGIARNIGRKGQETVLLTLADLRDAETDMFTTVFIGNADTRVLRGKLVTLRGYHER